MDSSAIVITFIVFFIGSMAMCAHRVNAQIAQRRATLAAIVRNHENQTELPESQGLDPEAIKDFPIVKYSDVKDIQIGKGILECVICLTEFRNEDLVRLLPECDHVYHPLCIDQWLASHATCPVCRTNLLQPPQSNNDSLSAHVDGRNRNYHVAIQVDEEDLRCPTANLNNKVRSPDLQRDGNGVVFGHVEECSRTTYRDARDSC